MQTQLKYLPEIYQCGNRVFRGLVLNLQLFLRHSYQYSH